MTNRTIDLLTRANPVQGTPSMEPPERLRRLIEAEGQPAPAHRRRGIMARRGLPRALVALATAGGAAAASLMLASAPSNPNLNVAAAAYATVSSGGGVLEAHFLDRMFVGPHRRAVSYEHREWLDPSTGMRRDRRTLPPPLGRNVTFEMASSPGWVETWNNGSFEKEREAIHRVAYHLPTLAGERNVGEHMPFDPVEGIEAFRRLYLDGSIKLVGHARLHGRRLWKLEAVAGIASYGHGEAPRPIETVVILVDPSTYLPMVQRVIDVLHKPTVQSETELLGYRRLPAGPASEALLKLTSQHPRARVLTR